MNNNNNYNSPTLSTSSSSSSTSITTSTSTSNTSDSNTSLQHQPKKIHKLSVDVINRINAGEVVLRPSNALKELIENSLDAHSTIITVTLKDGGLKLLQIQDNGCGIKLEDMDIVCERFTTSKLTSFEDLRKITTFGFRGEALSSISHCAHLKILTKTYDSACAYRAHYHNGKLHSPDARQSAEPKPCAGVNGTQITVEDLFYNNPSRKLVIKNTLEEHNRIVDLIRKYAINNSTITFILKKFGDPTPDVHTPGNLTEKEAIAHLYGSEVGRELKELSVSNDKLEFDMKGFFSSTNYSGKKMTFILFINNRLVESKNLKTGIQKIYEKYLPKGTHPFAFVRLQLNPKNVDVNCSPTKNMVQFLNEEAIIEMIQKIVDQDLVQSINSRSFSTQVTLPDFDSTSNDAPSNNNNTNKGATSTTQSTSATSKSNKAPAILPSQLIRSDSKTQPISAFIADEDNDSDFRPNQLIFTKKSNNKGKDGGGGPLNANDSAMTSDMIDEIESSGMAPPSPQQPTTTTTTTSTSTTTSSNDDNTSDGANNNTKKHKLDTETTSVVNPNRTKRYKPTELTSIKDLLKTVDNNLHSGLQEFFSDCVFVGCLDHTFSLAQHKTKLYLINVEILSKELIYQSILRGFAAFDTIKFVTPLSINTMILTSLDSPCSGWQPEDGSKEKIADYLTKLLISKASMLHEYFSIDIIDGHLAGIPQILDNYVPCMDNLPVFMLHLATEVDWEFEKECFDSIAKELSVFYKIEASLPVDNNNNNNTSTTHNGQKRNGREWVIQHLIFPALKRLVPPKSFSNDGTIIMVTSLEKLFKVFERC
ncbi:hypothetical protein SAMD00019534_098940 [Acytostelium subglobosum LB1]|uniref:hypothetical protein n=1 Tax=Acytostelium subglobosum LB1 TaxID=1410327 RepID=UPI000644C091|nr:hypothetical protein SAMD00019534_098940 [Acytostelium subglobosum LB1]GAM26719.1 hypothetical protein SAMD00019534_098940 [Acytostelium subglobosum LB1]|eukprot:XP_012750380.1 hypothetical protein SAMD00019534_098940 [Acytostelium subglobosum LB1]